MGEQVSCVFGASGSGYASGDVIGEVADSSYNVTVRVSAPCETIALGRGNLDPYINPPETRQQLRQHEIVVREEFEKCAFGFMARMAGCMFDATNFMENNESSMQVRPVLLKVISDRICKQGNEPRWKLLGLKGQMACVSPGTKKFIAVCGWPFGSTLVFKIDDSWTQAHLIKFALFILR
jgi:hypothetical protein